MSLTEDIGAVDPLDRVLEYLDAFCEGEMECSLCWPEPCACAAPPPGPAKNEEQDEERSDG